MIWQGSPLGFDGNGAAISYDGNAATLVIGPPGGTIAPMPLIAAACAPQPGRLDHGVRQ